MWIKARLGGVQKRVRITEPNLKEFLTAAFAAFGVPALTEGVKVVDSSGTELDHDVFEDVIKEPSCGVLTIQYHADPGSRVPSTGLSGPASLASSGAPDPSILSESPPSTGQRLDTQAKHLVESILTKRPGGERIINEYKGSLWLTDETRREMVNILAAHMTQRYGTSPPREVKEMYARGIVKLFPSLRDPSSRNGYEHYYDGESGSGYLAWRIKTLQRSTFRARRASSGAASEGVSHEDELGGAAARAEEYRRDLQEHSEGGTMKLSRSSASLLLLTRRFLQLMQEAPGGCVDLSYVSTRLKTKRRRLYDITNALSGVQVIEKESKNKVRWIGKWPISVFLSRKNEVEKLRQVEAALDGLIRSCAQQLFDLTDDHTHSPWAYVTHRDLRLLQPFRGQTLIAVRAPEETRMEIPVPTQDSVQIHLKATQEPITVLTCDLGPGVAAETTARFLALEESRIQTKIHLPDSGSSAQDS